VRKLSIPVLLAALLALTLLFAPAASAGKDGKPKGTPRLTVSQIKGPPAHAVEVGDRVDVEVTVRNRGRRAGRSGLKLIIPDAKGSFTGEKLAIKKKRHFAGKSKRTFALHFDVPQKLAPAENDTSAAYEIAACVRHYGKGTEFRCKSAKHDLTVEIPPLPPKFEAGARTAGDTLFPQIGNGGYDATHYALDLSYDPSNNHFRAGTHSVMTATATQNLGEFSLDFQYLTVTKVTVNGAPAPFELVDAKPHLAGATQPVKLVVTPPEGILDGEQFTVDVHYRGEPVEIIDPDGSSEGWVRACIGVPTPLTCDGGVVVNEPVGAAGWFPNNNVPTDKATYRTAITTPDSHTALGNGELTSKQPLPGGEAKWTWTESNPMASYLTTATVGDFIYTEDTIDETTPPARTIPAYWAIDSDATPPQQTGLEASFARVESMINFLGGLYGPYPFDSAGAIADNVPTLGYALEVQTKPVFAFLSANDETMLHEQAHQWFGDSVSPTQWTDIWFNEGWAEWSTWYWANLENGATDTPADIFDDNYASASASDWSVPPATLNGDPALLFDHFSTYVRAPMMLEGLRQIIGDTKFFAFAKDIMGTYGGGNITTQQFIDLAKQDSGLSGADLTLLNTYFQQWLYGNVKPTVLPSSF